MNILFLNEPLADFTERPQRAAFQDAINGLDARLASGRLAAGPLIRGREVSCSERVCREDPANAEILLGEVGYATCEDADQALTILHGEGRAWSSTPAEDRIRCIVAAGEIMANRRFDLAALIVREAGKPWREADADVAEAIDFCRYYGAQMRRLATPQPTSDLPGEENFYLYGPRGIAVVIAPWNFPLAIPCGMTVAALVAGNRTILKPAEQSSLIGFAFAKILLEAGVPPTAFAFLPGKGETVGRYLVEDRRVGLIAFTGSKGVGLEILRSATELAHGQQHVKRVIAEMGKNAIIVDDDADFDEAIKGVLYSAFGYAGQKCSACSRLLVVGDAYEPFVTRLCEAAADITVGEPRSPATYLGPVIDQEAQKRLLHALQEASKRLRPAFRGEVPPHGYFVPPTIFRDVPVDDPIWREELFGPVLACHKAASFGEALEKANDSQYALTGAIFSRHPDHISRAKAEFQVGNLYINRGSTGALVGRQPFGGFKLSGVGSKAGGPDYLLQFLEPRTVTENTVRRGFAPEIENPRARMAG